MGEEGIVLIFLSLAGYLGNVSEPIHLKEGVRKRLRNLKGGYGRVSVHVRAG